MFIMMKEHVAHCNMLADVVLIIFENNVGLWKGAISYCTSGFGYAGNACQ